MNCKQRFLRLVEIPVEPADLVVLAIRVVVALLRRARSRRPPQIIGTPCENSRVARKLRFCRSRSIDDVRVVSRALHAIVPGVVVVGAIVVVFAVRLVVLLVVADQVAAA